MRYTLTQAAKERSREALVGWWEDWPVRRRHFWRTLLFEPGQGWLKWKSDEVSETQYIDEGLSYPEYFPVFPPLHRAWMAFTSFWAGLFMTLRGQLEWQSVIPSREDLKLIKDPDRRRNLWEVW